MTDTTDAHDNLSYLQMLVNIMLVINMLVFVNRRIQTHH